MKNNNVKNVNNNVTNVKDVNVSNNHENSVNDQTVNSVRSDEKVSNVLPVESDEKINKKWDTNTIQFLVSNVNGIKSKYQSLSNICNQNGIRVMILSETHTAGGIEPFVDKNFKAFYNNRNKKKYSTCKGGVAILYERGLANHVVILDKISEVNEVIITRNNAFSPPLIVAAVYGGQESQYTKEEMKSAWTKLLNTLETYHEKGFSVMWGGDLNSWIGNSCGLTKNHSSVNTSGRIIRDYMKSNKHWKLLNCFDNQKSQTTHRATKKGDSERCLDFLFSNVPHLCKGFRNDEANLVTPYRVVKNVRYKTKGKVYTMDKELVKKDGEIDLELVDIEEESRKYTDHNSLYCKMVFKRDKKAKISKPPPVILKSEESDERYAFKTDEVAEEIMEAKCKGATARKLYIITKKGLRNANWFAYERLAHDKIKIKFYEDQAMLRSLEDKIEKEFENLGKMKTERKIWKINKKRKADQEHEELTSIFNKEGFLVETKKEIDQALADYNESLLSRKSHPEDFKKLHELKKEIVEKYITKDCDDNDTVTEEEYIRVLKKIHFKKKGLFNDFLKASTRFKAAFYWVIKAIYDEEDVHEDLLETTLHPLFKKGDRRLPQNYRFIHLKSWVSRIYELILYFKLEEAYERITGEAQHGGKKKTDCVEQLSVILHLNKQKEKKGGGVSLLLCDIKKCFDCIFLSDAVFPLAEGNANVKATRQLYNSKKINKIVFKGSDATFDQEGGIGQGGHNDPRNAGSVITDSFERNFDNHEDPTKFHEETVEMSQFVDDSSCMSSDNINTAAENSRISGHLMTLSLDEISLEAHDKKTVQVLIGSKSFIERTKEELAKLPVMIQNFEVQVVESDKLLGVTMCEGSTSEILTRNLEEKHAKIQSTAYEIRAQSQDPGIQRLGRLKFVAMMIQAKVVSQALYGLEAFPNLDPDQYKMLKSMFSNAITIALGLPRFTCYEALLYELKQYPLEVWADVAKLKYYSKKFNEKRRGRLYRILRYEVINDVEDGYVKDLEILCKKYNIRSIIDNEVDEREITKAGKDQARRQIWNKLLTCKSIPLMPAKYEKMPAHYEFTDFKSRLISQLRTGTLLFRNKYGHFFRKRHQNDKSCMFQACDGKDELIHVMHCPFYPIRFQKTEKGEAEDWGSYLLELSKFRAKEWGESLVFSPLDWKRIESSEKHEEEELMSAWEVSNNDVKQVESKLKQYRKKVKVCNNVSHDKSDKSI